MCKIMTRNTVFKSGVSFNIHTEYEGSTPVSIRTNLNEGNLTKEELTIARKLFELHLLGVYRSLEGIMKDFDVVGIYPEDYHDIFNSVVVMASDPKGVIKRIKRVSQHRLSGEIDRTLRTSRFISGYRTPGTRKPSARVSTTYTLAEGNTFSISQQYGEDGNIVGVYYDLVDALDEDEAAIADSILTLAVLRTYILNQGEMEDVAMPPESTLDLEGIEELAGSPERCEGLLRLCERYVLNNSITEVATR